MTTSYSLGIFPPYPGETRYSDPQRQCREGPLKAAPTQMGRWTLAAVRRAPDITLILDGISQRFTVCMAGLLGGTGIEASRLQKKCMH